MHSAGESTFYNMERTHQSLDYRTPDLVYRTAGGGGASIADKFSVKKKLAQEQNTETRPGSAVPLHVKGYPLKLHPILS